MLACAEHGTRRPPPCTKAVQDGAPAHWLNPRITIRGLWVGLEVDVALSYRCLFLESCIGSLPPLPYGRGSVTALMLDSCAAGKPDDLFGNVGTANNVLVITMDVISTNSAERINMTVLEFT